MPPSGATKSQVVMVSGAVRANSARERFPISNSSHTHVSGKKVSPGIVTSVDC